MPVLVGTSGWQYADWRGRFYPPGLAQARWLDHFSQAFDTVEVNNAFYRLPEAATFERWRDSTPDGFVFSVKASRYLTHIRRLKDPEEPVARLLERATHLGAKLGPILLQLPPNLRRDVGALEATLDAFNNGRVRVAFEPRHASWHDDRVAEILAHHNAAFCLTDTPHRKSPRWRTADWGYVRFHEGRSSPHPCYGRTALHSWAARLADLWGPGDDVFAYFNNDTGGCAVRDAHRFAGALGSVGLDASRVPSARAASLSGR